MRDYSLYVLTDEGLAHGQTHVELASLAIEGGADVIQLRDKNLDSSELYQTAVKIARLCQAQQVTFIVNDGRILHKRPELTVFMWVRVTSRRRLCAK